MKRILLVLLLLCAGCGPPMTARQKIMFGMMVGAQYADYETSRRMIHPEDGSGLFHEMNPILDEHPSRDELALFKVGVIGVFWGLGEIWPQGREFFYGIGILSGGLAAGHNDRLYRQWK